MSTTHESRATRGLGAALTTVAFFGAVIGGVGAPLITSVAVNLGVSLDSAQWTLTATLFSGAISAPVLGRLGTGSHRRTALLITLALVASGGVLTVIPLPFGVLLVGRALQGLGLGAVSLLMSIARDHLPEERASSTIATISVASTVGIGVAYPFMGFLDQFAGLRVAYGVGLLISAAAVVVAWRSIPQDPPRATPRIDLPGAILLGLGTLGILLVLAQPSTWSVPWIGSLILVVALVILVIWVLVELRVPSPLVDLRLLVRSSVLRANFAMLIVGIGMYLLFSTLTRYVQAPADAGYGFALPGVLAGAALIPFSLLGFVAGKIAPIALRHASPPWVYSAAALTVVIAAILFALIPDSLVTVLWSMAVLGFGVGGVSAVMPRLVLAHVPKPETASVLSINQIVRAVGFSVGSALAGLVLAANTAPGDLNPAQAGYATAAGWVIPFVAISIVVASTRRRR